MQAAADRLCIHPSPARTRVNDVHSKLNDTEVCERVAARNETDVVAASAGAPPASGNVRRASRDGRAAVRARRAVTRHEWS
jgi:hypothetical protein